MPYSSDEGKAWMADRIWSALLTGQVRFDEDGAVLAPRLLDVGAGSGTYAKLLAAHRPTMAAHLTAVEVHEPYVGRYGLRQLYDEVVVGDARTVEFPAAEVVVLGDVLEHMRFGDAKALWTKARLAATSAVFASLPIVEWPQGPVGGNEHEAHVRTWLHGSVLAGLGGIVEWEVGPSIGVYRATPLRGGA